MAHQLSSLVLVEVVFQVELSLLMAAVVQKGLTPCDQLWEALDLMKAFLTYEAVQ